MLTFCSFVSLSPFVWFFFFFRLNHTRESKNARWNATNDQESLNKDAFIHTIRYYFFYFENFVYLYSTFARRFRVNVFRFSLPLTAYSRSCFCWLFAECFSSLSLLFYLFCCFLTLLHFTALRHIHRALTRSLVHSAECVFLFDCVLFASSSTTTAYAAVLFVQKSCYFLLLAIAHLYLWVTYYYLWLALSYAYAWIVSCTLCYHNRTFNRICTIAIVTSSLPFEYKENVIHCNCALDFLFWNNKCCLRKLEITAKSIWLRCVLGFKNW